MLANVENSGILIIFWQFPLKLYELKSWVKGKQVCTRSTNSSFHRSREVEMWRNRQEVAI